MKNHVIMLCMLSGLSTVAHGAGSTDVAAFGPVYVSFEAAMGESSCRQSLLAGHRSVVDEGADDDLGDVGLALFGADLCAELAEADEQCTGHHLLELDREAIEPEIFIPCSCPSSAARHAEQMHLAEHRAVRNSLEQKEQGLNQEYLNCLKRIVAAYEGSGEDVYLLYSQLNEITGGLHKSADALAALRINAAPESVEFLRAKEAVIQEAFGNALSSWVAKLKKGYPAPELEADKCKLGQQLEEARRARERAEEIERRRAKQQRNMK